MPNPATMSGEGRVAALVAGYVAILPRARIPRNPSRVATTALRRGQSMEPERSFESEHAAVSSKVELQAILWRMRADLERLVAEAGPTRMELPGAAGDWTLKDVVAHLADWRWWSVARLEAAARGEAPAPPWGEGLDEDDDADIERINQQFYEASRDRPVAAVLRDSRETLDRLEAALLALPEADLFAADRYPWLGGYPAAAVVTGSAGHLYDEHEPAITDFLARSNQR